MTGDALKAILKEIGRGKNAARDISRDDARTLFAAMLAGEVPPLQLGAALMAFRIKGESLDELAGFLEASEASYAHLQAPARSVPLVIPAYNGARKLPNLTPLLAMLVARKKIRRRETTLVEPSMISRDVLDDLADGPGVVGVIVCLADGAEAAAGRRIRGCCLGHGLIPSRFRNWSAASISAARLLPPTPSASSRPGRVTATRNCGS